MTVLIDTNVIIDFFEERVPFVRAAQQVLLQCAEDKCNGLVCASSVTDIYYLLRKRNGKAKALEQTLVLLDMLTAAEVAHSDLLKAGESGMPDFEDAVIAYSAKRSKADYIITRNISDFKNSPVPALLPEDFLALQ